MSCQKCNSDRILTASGKTSDLFNCSINDNEHEGYVPADLGIGSGDYVELDLCLNCGQLQGTWPLPTTELENDNGEEDDDGLTWRCMYCKKINDTDDNPTDCWKCGESRDA